MNRNSASDFKNLVRRLLRKTTSHNWIRSILLHLSKNEALPEWLWTRLPVDATFQIEIPDKTIFLYASNSFDTIGRALFWKGLTNWEAETIPVFYKIAKQAKIVLDIGANTGFYTLLACAANPKVEVFSFEPVPTIFTCLENNITVNSFQKRCKAMQKAVSNKNGKVDFCELDVDVLPTSSTLNTDGFRGYKGKIYQVDSITIDSLDFTNNWVDLVKIDVEGFEDAVLEGMTSLFMKHRPAVIVECNFDGPYQAVERILKSQGYFMYHITSNGLIPHDHIKPDAAGKFLNFLCLPEIKTSFLAGIFE
ncbi:MAG: FkbM family methyltransferase [Chloroflexota bacterium]